MSFIIGAIAAALAGLIQGSTGFGFAMIMVPALFLSFEPTTAVPMVASLGTLQAAYMAIRYRAFIQRRILLPLGAGGLIGVPFGVHALTTVEGPVVKTAVGILMIVLAMAFYFDLRRPVENQTAALPFVGLLSGFMGGSTGLTGPAVILFLANQGAPRDVFRASLVAYFTLVGVLTLALFAFRGMLTGQVVLHVGALVPITFGGVYLGANWADRISERQFRRVAMACAGVMGVLLVIQNQVT